MKHILWTAAACLSLATMAAAGEPPPLRPEDNVQQAAEAAKQAEDCSKQVWPFLARLSPLWGQRHHRSACDYRTSLVAAEQDTHGNGPPE